MTKSKWIVLRTPLTLLIGACWIFACGEENKTEEEEVEECEPVPFEGDGATGDPCMIIEDCQSGFCSSFAHVPQDTDATCQASPEIGHMQIQANVADFVTNEAIPNQLVEFTGALDVVQTPVNFPVLDSATTDDEGHIDILLSGDATDVGVGVVTVTGADGYYPTTTGMAEPELGCGIYPPGTRNHDIKMIKTEDIDNFSDMLAADFPDLVEEGKLPLGEEGGVLGSILHVLSGDGVAGATLASQKDNSAARVFYLNETMDHFTEDAASSNGIFVVLNPGLAEKFDGVVNGEIASRRHASMGESKGVLFTTIVHITDQE